MKMTRTTMRIEWDPPRTPHNLLQEQYYPDRWKVAVICMFLNCTQRKTAEPIVHKFFARYPTPEHYIWAYEWDARSDLVELISPLGFGNRRAERIFKFSLDYLALDWKRLSECHGIGEYADACDRIFFEMDFDETPPSDGVLANVWRWVVKEKRNAAAEDSSPKTS
jgi:methyl-CpG-binding domain protein 4